MLSTVDVTDYVNTRMCFIAYEFSSIFKRENVFFFFQKGNRLSLFTFLRFDGHYSEVLVLFM